MLIRIWLRLGAAPGVHCGPQLAHTFSNSLSGGLGSPASRTVDCRRSVTTPSLDAADSAAGEGPSNRRLTFCLSGPEASCTALGGGKREEGLVGIGGRRGPPSFPGQTVHTVCRNAQRGYGRTSTELEWS